MSTTIISWILLFAAAQGLFLGAVLLLPAATSDAEGRQRNIANRLIAALVFVFVVIIADAWCSLTGWYWQAPQLLHASIAFPLLIGPLLFLHLQINLWHPPITKTKLWHFFPFLIGILLWSPYYLMSNAEKLALLRNTTAIPWYISLFAAFKLLHMGYYFYLALRMIREARRLRPNDSLTASLFRLAIYLGVGVVSVLLLFLVEHFYQNLAISSDTLGAIMLTIFVYALAIRAIRQPLHYQAQVPLERPRYAGHELSKELRAAFLAKLIQKMDQDQVYKNGDLKLDTLAEILAMTPHELSQLVNVEYDTNFQDFLNRYRVDALKSALQEPANHKKTVLELAIACGFNSKSAMNRAFKKITGITPSEFRREPEVLP